MKRNITILIFLIAVIFSVSALSACDFIFGDLSGNKNTETYLLESVNLYISEEHKKNSEITDEDAEQLEKILNSRVGKMKIRVEEKTVTFNVFDKDTSTFYYLNDELYLSKEDLTNKKPKSTITFNGDTVVIDFGSLSDFTDGSYCYLTFRKI